MPLLGKKSSTLETALIYHQHELFRPTLSSKRISACVCFDHARIRTFSSSHPGQPPSSVMKHPRPAALTPKPRQAQGRIIDREECLIFQSAPPLELWGNSRGKKTAKKNFEM